MVRKMVGAVCVLALSLGFVLAEDFGGSITKIDGNKITVMKKAKAKGEKGEEVTLEVAKDAKVIKGKLRFALCKWRLLESETQWHIHFELRLLLRGEMYFHGS